MRVIYALPSLLWLVILPEASGSPNGFGYPPAIFGLFSKRGRRSQSKNPRRRLHWTHHQDPNPNPNLDDLEESVTTEEIDQVLEELTAMRSGLVLNRYLPARRYLWQQWRDSVLRHSFPRACWNMWGTAIFCILMRYLLYRDLDFWKLLSNDVPPTTQMSVILDIFKLIGLIWKSLSTLTTFLLVFFVSETYSFWRSVYEIARMIQGQMNDIHLILAAHAARRRVSGTYTPEAQLFLEDIASKLRAYHICMWATHARRFRCVLTAKGYSRMVAKGVLTSKEKETLDMQLGVPKDQKHYILLEWILFKCREARKRRVIDGENGMEHVLLGKVCALRDCSSQLSSKMSGRMPLPYIHLVQILLDTFLLVAPLAQYVTQCMDCSSIIFRIRFTFIVLHAGIRTWASSPSYRLALLLYSILVYSRWQIFS
jgi:hypothetical protein